MEILGVVFTTGVSLKIWVDRGLLDREKQIYEEHLRQGHFDKIIWFTYGTEDNEIRDRLVESGRLESRIQVVPMPKYFFYKKMAYLYSCLLPFIQKKYCKGLDIIKTNQMNGAWTAEMIHRKYAVPFLLRTGYTYSLFLMRKDKETESWLKKGKLKYIYRRYKKIENYLYHQCSHATVSSEHDRTYICEQYAISDSNISILTNYIDCSLFKSRISKQVEKNNRFLFVGRLSLQKNLFRIIQALGEMGIGLDIYGKGEQCEELMEFVRKRQFDVCFRGVVSNQELASIYNQYQYYILASLYEGMPKTLLEAMACGCICFGTDVEGIREVIKNKETGYIIDDVSVESIKRAVSGGIGQEDNAQISERAVQYIKKYHSLETIVTKEWEIMRRIGGE